MEASRNALKSINRDSESTEIQTCEYSDVTDCNTFIPKKEIKYTSIPVR